MYSTDLTAPQPLSFNVQTACALTGIGRTRFYELLNTGDISSRKIGKRRIILRADLEAFLATQPATLPSEAAT